MTEQQKIQIYSPDKLTAQDVYTWLNAIATATPLKEGNKVIKTRDRQVEELVALFPAGTRVFRFLLNKFKLTNLATAKLNKSLDLTGVQAPDSFESFLDFLENDVDGTDESVRKVQAYIQSEPESLREFLSKLATKSFKTGVAVSTYNKLADLHKLERVPDFDVQLADNITKQLDKYHANYDKYLAKVADGAKVKAPKFPLVGTVTATEKFDGVRCLVIRQDDHVQFMTRDGRQILGLSELADEFNALDFGDRVFDGELLVDQETNAEERAEDAFRATMKIVGSKGEKVGLRYHIFDTLTSTTRYLRAESQVPYAQRRQWLDDHTATIEQQTHLSVAPVLDRFTIDTLDDVNAILALSEKITAVGGEGIMLNYDDAKYEFKRTNRLLKVKQANESDGEVVGTFMGQGEFEGLLGGIIVKYHDVTVRVGSGFSKAQREQYATDPDQLIGQMATYAFTTESHDVDGNLSLRFPRFKAFRLDKTPADASYDN